MTEEELAENEDPTTEATTDTDEPVPAEPVTEEDRIAELEAQVSDLQQALLRTRADFDNIRKRLRREADEAGGRAVARFVRPMLSELDNFGHAIVDGGLVDKGERGWLHVGRDNARGAGERNANRQ